MLTSRPEHVSARGPGAARHSCAVSHRLFTEQELTFPQTRPRPPGGKGKAGQGLARSRPHADPGQTDTAAFRASSAGRGNRADQGRGTSSGTCPTWDPCCGSERCNRDAHRMGHLLGLSLPTHPQNQRLSALGPPCPPPWLLGAWTPGGSLSRERRGAQGSLPPGSGLSTCL